MKFKFSIPYIIGALSLCGLSNTNAANASDENNIKQDSLSMHLAYAIRPTIPANYFMPRDTILYPVRAIPRNKDVLYICENGDTITRCRGTRAWRNNNPGCLRYGKFSRENGAIGECGGFAVFPDETTGMMALCTLLSSNSYRNLTISAAVAKYAPACQNNVGLYISKLCRQTGLRADTKLCNLNPEQLQIVANAIRKIEG